jgi:hypothetical protein
MTFLVKFDKIYFGELTVIKREGLKSYNIEMQAIVLVGKTITVSACTVVTRGMFKVREAIQPLVTLSCKVVCI